MSTTGPFNPFVAAFVAIVLTMLAAMVGATLLHGYYPSPEDKLALIARVIMIGLSLGSCLHLCRTTRGLGRTIPLLSLTAIVGLVAYIVVWTLS